MSAAEDQPAAFGVLLRGYRAAAGLTQEALAEQAGLSARAITDLERGVRRFPYPDTVERLARALSLSPERHAALFHARHHSTAATPADEQAAFGALLRRYRTAAGLSQAALAERAGLSRRGIADLERGARNFPYGDTARRLADALGLTTIERATLLAAGQRPEPATARRRAALPIEPSSLIGRERELAELRLLLKSVRLLTLTGSAGIGKTRLALELARLIEPDFRDGAVFVNLAPLTDPALVPHAVAVAVGVREQGHTDVMQTLQEHLHQRQLLVVLDNCEHVLLSSAMLADALVRTCPALRIVATSREAMRIGGETAWPVPSLRLDEASQLFLARARAAQARWHLAEDDANVISEICRGLDGIPLAIELAAARVPVLGLAQIAHRLTERLRLLSGGSRLEAPRHQTLRAAIGWSYDLLSDEERRLFERLSVFAGGFEVEAMGPVCDGDLDILAGLVEKSLVVADQRGALMRYRLLETIREYASERLELSGQADELRRRHAAYYRSLAEAGAVTRRGLRYARNMGLVSQEHDNLRTALSTLLASGELDDGLAVCEALSGFWLSQGYLNEGDAWLCRFLERAECLRSEGLAQSLYTAARIAEYRGAFDLAQSHLEHSLRLARDNGDATHAARALFGLGDVAVHQGDLDQGYAAFQEGLSLGRAAGVLPDVAEALVSVARIEALRGRAARARAACEEALQIQRRLGDAWGVAYVLNELGLRARADGELERAQATLEEAHALWRESGSRMGQRAALMNLTVLAIERGALLRAATLARKVLELCREMADTSATTVRCLEIAARVLQTFGAAEVAVCLAGAAEAQRDRLGAPIPPDERTEREGLLQAARAVLAPHGFEQAWHGGARLSMQQAVELAADGLTSQLESQSG